MKKYLLLAMCSLVTGFAGAMELLDMSKDEIRWAWIQSQKSRKQAEEQAEKPAEKERMRSQELAEKLGISACLSKHESKAMPGNKGWRRFSEAFRTGNIKDVVRTATPEWLSKPVVEWERRTALHVAVIKNNLALVGALLVVGADVNALTRYRNTPLHFAQSLEMAQLLIEWGAPVDTINTYGESPLHCAVARGRRDIAHYLLEKGVDVNVRPIRDGKPAGSTPLHSAAVAGHLDCVRLLVERGADRTAKDDTYWQRTARDLAETKHHQEVVAYLDSLAI